MCRIQCESPYVFKVLGVRVTYSGRRPSAVTYPTEWAPSKQVNKFPPPPIFDNRLNSIMT